jgi:ketosteroid isomerase-like protein
MSEQPDRGADSLAAVRRGFELFNAGDLGTLFTETFHPEITYRGDPDISALAGFPTDAEGTDDVRAVWEAFFAMFDEVELTEVELTLQDENTVLGRCRMVTRGGSSGAPIDAPFYFAWVLRDGRWAFMPQN